MIPDLPDIIRLSGYTLDSVSNSVLILFVVSSIVVFGCMVVLPLVNSHFSSSRVLIAVQVPPGQRISDEFEEGEWVVVCPICGSRNEFGYEYCHSCIRQLPPATKF